MLKVVPIPPGLVVLGTVIERLATDEIVVSLGIVPSKVSNEGIFWVYVALLKNYHLY